MEENKTITMDVIGAFLNGHNPMEHIIKIECSYFDESVTVIYRGEDGKKHYQKDEFHPFCWTKQEAARLLFNGDRALLKKKMSEYGIACKGLRTTRNDGTEPDRMKLGYRVLFYAMNKMSYNKFLSFFKEAKVPIYPSEKHINYGKNWYVTVSPDEQYMIATGKRLFKGYDDYNELKRLVFDIETDGLEHKKFEFINQIGVKTNRGFKQIENIVGEGDEKFDNEINAIDNFFNAIAKEDPDIITGHNIFSFDFPYIDYRISQNGITLDDDNDNCYMYEFTKKRFKEGIKLSNKEKVLKLGGEMEYFKPTVMWGTSITDSLHAVRRAQAIDSNMKKATLKYATIYGKMVKKNRVYVDGSEIDSTWKDKEKHYCFNDENGHWFKFDNEKRNELLDGELRYTIDNDKVFDRKNNEWFELKTGEYIVERYLEDDLDEGLAVEERYNSTNFQVAKLLPMSFEKVCTTGTAALWKYIMLAWSYENNLAIPELTPSKKFTGGLSRLVKCGKIFRQVKLDFNSLYPSIIISNAIKAQVDVMDAMLNMLEYILTQREYFKGLKSDAGKKANAAKDKLKVATDKNEILMLEAEVNKWSSEKDKNDKKQAQSKVLANSFFGGYGSGSSSGFYWSDIACAEQTTCTGRQGLRLLISWFMKKGYDPIVGDSVTGDTPLFINKQGVIDIIPIEELIVNSEVQVDLLGREYDASEKDYMVLCRSGWVKPQYVYRHKTDKPIYKVTDTEKHMEVEVTEDHSLFNSDKEEVKPSQITEQTELEYSETDIFNDFNKLNINHYWEVDGYDITTDLMNATIEDKIDFLNSYKKNINGLWDNSKTYRAKIQYLVNCVKNSDKYSH